MKRAAAILLVHVQPNARRTEVVGRHGDALKVRIAAPPVGGAANEELIRLLADRLGLSRSAITITRGAAGRRKRVLVAGLDRDRAMARLEAVSRSMPPISPSPLSGSRVD
ncbi:MAG TPA: DUF167 domain-containing protein [Gemmatimonadales bacterium]|nr:DUF167 domain-containing protein [Gemmatimonadales bacterium]